MVLWFMKIAEYRSNIFYDQIIFLDILFQP